MSTPATAPTAPANRRRRRLGLALGIPVGVLAILLLVVKLIYGLGRPYPDVTGDPLVPAIEVERAATLDLPLGNVTVSSGGRVFFNVHPFVQAQRFQNAYLYELVDGEAVPFPNAESQPDLEFVFGMNADHQGRLWLTSPATLDRERTRVQAFDIASGERVADHEFEPGVARFAQDLRVSADGETMYMADTGAFHFTPASLLVVDLLDWSLQTRLAGHDSTQPQHWYIQTDHGPHRIGGGLVTFAVGVDGIALSPDDAWLYYATMTHDTLYRVPTALLRDPTVDEATLAAAIETIGQKPLSDGIETDAEGRVLVTDVEHGALVRISQSGTLETVFRDPEVVWSDGVSVAPNGDIYVTDSAIPSYLDPLLRPPRRDILDAHAPYPLLRIPAAPVE